MAGDTKPNILSESIGLRIKKLCAENYKNKSECARAFGVKPQNWGRIEAGKMKFDPDEIFKFAAFFGVDPGWLLTGRSAGGESAPEPGSVVTATPIADLPPGNAIRRKGDQDAAHKILYLTAVGDAAALEVGASHRGGFDDKELFWENEIQVPESTHLIRIRGDSMSPVMLHGQFVMVGDQYRVEIGDVPGHRDIVVASISVQNNDIGGMDGEWEGVQCKRIQDAGDFWLFTSINPSGATFTVAKDNCRLWRVIGVYFAGKGKPPRED